MRTKLIEVTIEDLGAVRPGDVLLHSNPDSTWTAQRRVEVPKPTGPYVATRVKSNLVSATGTAHLYRLDPPMWDGPDDEDGQEYEYVRVSAADVPFSGPETYIFGARPDGSVINWGELDGSYRGGLDHREALRRAGYEVTA